MNGIRSMLNLGANALAVQRGVMSVISKNISSANIPGYSRQRLELTDMGYGLGAQVSDHTSLRDTTLQRSLLGASQALGFEQGKANVLALAEPMVNGLDGVGTSQALDDFFASLSEAAASPGGLTQRESVLAHARALARSISEAAAGFEQARDAAQQTAAETVERVNSVTAEIAKLNQQIRSIVAAGEAAHELVDQRDELLGQLGELVDIEVVTTDGMANVSLSGGEPIVTGDHANVMAVGGGGPDPVSLTLLRADGGSLDGPTDPGGLLGGTIAARDETLRQALDQLDATAYGFISAINGMHTAGYGIDGLSERSLFQAPPTQAGAALSMQLAAEVDGHPERLAFAADPLYAAGDNTVLTQMLGVQDAAVGAGGRTPGEGLDLVMNTISRALSASEAQVQSEGSRVADLQAIRASRSGVSLQEEMVALTEAQRSFEAASRVVKVADELYDTVLRLV